MVIGIHEEVEDRDTRKPNFVTAVDRKKEMAATLSGAEATCASIGMIEAVETKEDRNSLEFQMTAGLLIGVALILQHQVRHHLLIMTILAVKKERSIESLELRCQLGETQN